MEPFVSGSVAQIADVAVRLEAAFNASDAVALASLYSDTAILMPPNEPMVSGRAGILAWFEKALQRLGSVSIVPIESTAVGDQAFQVGTFTSSAQTEATSSSTQDRPPALTGKYVLLLKHSAGHWKIQYDIWSLDQPIVEST
jgi:ketosteroid isomerase-like protein